MNGKQSKMLRNTRASKLDKKRFQMLTSSQRYAFSKLYKDDEKLAYPSFSDLMVRVI